MKLNICILLFISCISCQTSTKEYTQFVNQYLNRQLKLPQHILIKQCSDSIYLQNPAKYTSDSIYRITTYIYGDCYACVEDLIKWKQLLSQFSLKISIPAFKTIIDTTAPIIPSTGKSV